MGADATQIWWELPAWLAEHDLPPISETTPRGSTLLEVLLSSTRSEVTSLDMEIDVEI